MDKNAGSLDSDIVDSVRMVLIAVDRNLCITRWNRFSEKIYGISEANALGKNILEVLPVFAREHMEQYLSYVLSTGKDYTASSFEHISRQAYNIYITLKIVPIKNGSEVAGAVVFVDNITARKLAEEALRQKNKELAILNSITSAINRTKNLGDLLGLVLRESLELTGMDAGAVYLQDRDISGEMRLEKTLLRTPAGQALGFKGAVRQTTEVEADSIYSSKGQGTQFCETALENAAVSVYLPLSVKSKLLGTLVMGSATCPEGREGQTSLLLGIGSQLGFAVENSRLFDRINEAHDYLKDIINESPDPILTVDRNGRIRTFNRSASRLLSFEEADVVGKDLSAILPAGAHLDIRDDRSYVREFRTKKDSMIMLNISSSRIYKEDLNSDYIITLKNLSEIEGLRVVPLLEKAENTDQAYYLERGRIYLYDKQADRKMHMEIFSDQVKHNIHGLCITRQFPEKIRQEYQLEKTPIVWLMGGECTTGENCIKPDNLSALGSTISKFLSEADDGVVLLDGIEYLLSRNGFDSILKFFQYLNDKVMQSNSRAIICLDSLALDKRQYHQLTSEIQEMEAPMTS